MTDYDDYDDEPNEDESQEHTVNLNRQQIRAMERDAKRARKADEELAALKRENAFIKAGINPETDPKLKYFMNRYDGEITAEAIRAAAESAGFLTPTAAEGDTAEQTANERISQASAGAGNAPKTDPIQELYEADRTGGKEAVLATIRKHGHNIV